jgi:hypothetical protein
VRHARRRLAADPSDSTSRWTPCPLRFPSEPARHYSRLWIWCSPSEHQWDFNPPEHVAAQRTLRSPRTPAAPRSLSPVAYTSRAAPTRAAQTGLSCFVPLPVRVLRPLPRRLSDRRGHISGTAQRPHWRGFRRPVRPNGGESTPEHYVHPSLNRSDGVTRH